MCVPPMVEAVVVLGLLKKRKLEKKIQMRRLSLRRTLCDGLTARQAPVKTEIGESGGRLGRVVPPHR